MSACYGMAKIHLRQRRGVDPGRSSSTAPWSIPVTNGLTSSFAGLPSLAARDRLVFPCDGPYDRVGFPTKGDSHDEEDAERPGRRDRGRNRDGGMRRERTPESLRAGGSGGGHGPSDGTAIHR